MQPFQFFYGPKLLSGAGRASELAPLLPPGPCLLVTDAQVRALGLADAAPTSLETAGFEVRVFDHVEADPSLATLRAAVAEGQGYSSVVGFGIGEADARRLYEAAL